jgi:hypothetical protein
MIEHHSVQSQVEGEGGNLGHVKEIELVQTIYHKCTDNKLCICDKRPCICRCSTCGELFSVCQCLCKSCADERRVAVKKLEELWDQRGTLSMRKSYQALVKWSNESKRRTRAAEMLVRKLSVSSKGPLLDVCRYLKGDPGHALQHEAAGRLYSLHCYGKIKLNFEELRAMLAATTGYLHQRIAKLMVDVENVNS